MGIFLKRSRMFAELRPMTRWEAVTFLHPHTVHSTRTPLTRFVRGCTVTVQSRTQVHWRTNLG